MHGVRTRTPPPVRFAGRFRFVHAFVHGSGNEPQRPDALELPMHHGRCATAPQNDEQLAIGCVVAIPKPSHGDGARSHLDDASPRRAPDAQLAIECGTERGFGGIDETFPKPRELSGVRGQSLECAQERRRVQRVIEVSCCQDVTLSAVGHAFRRVTFSAAGPFCPSTTSNSTSSPSLRDL